MKISVLRTVILVLLFSSVAIPRLYAADVFDNCGGCHYDTVDDVKKRRIVHPPFSQGDCSQCHLIGREAAPATKKPELLREVEQREKISWFRDIRSPDTEHWILLPETKVDGLLYLKTWDGVNRSPLRTLNLPQLHRLPVSKSESQSPQISGLVVTEVRRGISTSATINWQTDEFTDSEVLYGQQGLNSSKYDRQLSRHHQAVLVGLEKNSTYQFHVLCRDIHGNQAASEVLNLKTDRTFIAPAFRRESNRHADQEIDLDWQLLQQDKNYLVIIKADRPISLSLGVEKQFSEKKSAEKKRKLAAAGGGHPLLKSQFDTNITLCYSCHSSFKGINSHPVNVIPKPGMEIPEEYPLLSDGRLSCMTCHVNHGGNYAHRLIKKSKKELCLGCHKNY